jgi:hypothetical protein
MIDSCTMQFPFDVCHAFNLDGMIHSPKYKGGELISDIHTASSDSLPMGVNQINVDMLNQYIKIQVSAKGLGDNYLDGINQNTFAQIINQVNLSGMIDLDEYASFEYGKFMNVDTTHNIDMGGYNNDLVGNWNSIYPHLSNAVNNPHFRPVVYTHKSNKGVTFMGDQKNEKNRLIAYCKIVELQTAKNRDFMRSLSNPMQMLNNVKNILRVEGNHTSFKSIKARMQVSDIGIKNILTNGRNPNVWMLDKITQPDKENQLILLLDMYSTDIYSFKEVLELEGIKSIIRKADYNPKTIANIVKSYNCNFDYWFYGDKRKRDGWKGLRKYIPELRALDSLEGGKPLTNELITYIREQMLKAS